jgi:diguanylate cyclase (GGDEF)-like protein
VGALAAAQRIVSAVAASPVRVDRKSLAVTTSAGVACLERSMRNGEELVANADRALYEAKDTGRNRAVLDGRPLALLSGGRRD